MAFNVLLVTFLTSEILTTFLEVNDNRWISYQINIL